MAGKLGEGLLTRRNVIKGGLLALGTAFIPEHLVNAETNLPWGNGKYQTFPRGIIETETTRTVDNIDMSRIKQTTETVIIDKPVLQNIDLGTLGPDVDTIAGLDFQGDIPTGALVVHMPKNGIVEETRVVFVKRTDLETVQINKALGGDRFDVYQMSKYGGDKALDAMARKHATNTARKHQKVVYLGDLGLFEKQWGEKEKVLLNRIIRAQRPAKPEIGIQEPDFVSPRVY
ncbi:MAG: hypothetical protein UR52_C0006G0009 [Candidatus Gottesmanbacteria bacterium GW2011_GWA1_34_13]|uniref:Uncharacterized protein n=1 Tax=Candidatus Gottesmanbacteria bacterium GW2011_GWA1_34_13 TaxID=1618434 RepID=A0A0G0ARG4_9BACT|nr:MAG: hypothetical protein UR52_C0006G0009 [Candidatus Gottesmanbacteria bacterium GW2011_GWA1_34_13]